MAALDPKNFSQVGFMVKDINKAAEGFAKLFGQEVPPVFDCGKPESETIYRGNPSPNAKCKQAFFNLVPGVQLELIQPNEEPSTWREYLNDHGEGIHHLGINVENTEEAVKECEKIGLKVVQRGFYDDRSGQYTYLDATDVCGCIIELLESFHK